MQKKEQKNFARCSCVNDLSTTDHVKSLFYCDIVALPDVMVEAIDVPE